MSLVHSSASDSVNSKKQQRRKARSSFSSRKSKKTCSNVPAASGAVDFADVPFIHGYPDVATHCFEVRGGAGVGDAAVKEVSATMDIPRGTYLFRQVHALNNNLTFTPDVRKSNACRVLYDDDDEAIWRSMCDGKKRQSEVHVPKLVVPIPMYVSTRKIRKDDKLVVFKPSEAAMDVDAVEEVAAAAAEGEAEDCSKIPQVATDKVTDTDAEAVPPPPPVTSVSVAAAAAAASVEPAPGSAWVRASAPAAAASPVPTSPKVPARLHMKRTSSTTSSSAAVATTPVANTNANTTGEVFVSSFLTASASPPASSMIVPPPAKSAATVSQSPTFNWDLGVHYTPRA